jgi:hypothetical protein
MKLNGFAHSFGMRLRPQENELFRAAFAASFDSSQNRCVLPPDVM